jgi:hypothetical protein
MLVVGRASGGLDCGSVSFTGRVSIAQLGVV